MRYRNEFPTVFKKGKYYYFWFYDGDKRKLKSTGCKLLNNARDYLRKFMDDRAGSSTRLKIVGKDFYLWGKCPIITMLHAKGRSFSKDHASARRGHWLKILEHFGDRNIEEITSTEVDNYLLKTKYSNQTKNHIMYAGKIAFEFLKVEPNPFDIKAFAVNPKVRSSLSKKEVALMFHPVTKTWWGGMKWYTLYNTLVKTGIRGGEARALRWRHIDTVARVVYILEAAKNDKDIGSPKTETSQRVIPLIDNSFDVLMQWRKETQYPDMDHFIFHGVDGDTMLTKRTISWKFSEALKNFKNIDPNRNLVPHSLRHTYVSLVRPYLEANGHKDVIKYLSGHSSQSALEGYTHDQLSQRIDLLNQAMEGFDLAPPAHTVLHTSDTEESTQYQKPTGWEVFE